MLRRKQLFLLFFSLTFLLFFFHRFIYYQNLLTTNKIGPHLLHTLLPPNSNDKTSTPHNFHGFVLDKNILFDGIGEFDYLRGEPSSNKGSYILETTTDLKTKKMMNKINAKKSDLNFFSGSLEMKYTTTSVQTGTLNYLHCNSRNSFNKETLTKSSGEGFREKKALNEILLLQDAKYSMDFWKESEIVSGLCLRGLSAVLLLQPHVKSYVSVTVIDLDPSANGFQFYNAINTLKAAKILSGQPLVIVSPGASGNILIRLGALASEVVTDVRVEDESLEAGLFGESGFADSDTKSINQYVDGSETQGTNAKKTEVSLFARSPSLPEEHHSSDSISYYTGSLLLTHLVKAWISIATVDVLESSAEALRAFLLADINIISIHGRNDFGGKRSTERLMELAGARGVELESGEPFYFKDPNDFVEKLWSCVTF